MNEKLEHIRRLFFKAGNDLRSAVDLSHIDNRNLKSYIRLFMILSCGNIKMPLQSTNPIRSKLTDAQSVVGISVDIIIREVRP